MKKQYINPIIEFHTASLQTFMENVFSDNEGDVKERGEDFEEEEDDFEEGLEAEESWAIQKNLW